jgi:hypothetical protein
MIDARIILDELEIQCGHALTDAAAARFAREIATALGDELRGIQGKRVRDFQAGESAPCCIRVRRASVRLDDLSTPTQAIARSIASEIMRGLRRHA